MKPSTLLSLVTLSGLFVATGCSGHDPAMVMSEVDQAQSGPHDMATPGTFDAADPNPPGLVRYSYICDDKPEKTVELPHVRFGATYSCNFGSDYFSINVKDDRVPVDFRLSVPQYHGPGTYTIIADKVSGTGFVECRWPSLRIQDSNCPALSGQLSSCCLAPDAQAKVMSCTVTVQQHSLSRVSGLFECQILADRDGPDKPFTCPYLGKVQVQGSFDFGPMDCT